MHQLSSDASNLITRVRWYIKLRWYILAVMCFSGLFSIIISEGLSSRFWQSFMVGSIAVLSNGVFYLLGRLNKGDRFFSYLGVLILTSDILAIGLGLHVNGGIESQVPILFVLPILATAAIFGRKAVYTITFAAAATFTGLIFADYSGLISSMNKMTGLSGDFSYILNTVIFIGLIMFFVGFLADYLTSLLVQKERQATETANALKRAQEVARLGSWEWDIPNDKLTWSEQLYKMYGVKQDGSALSYETYQKLVHPDDYGKMHHTIQKSLKTGQSFKFQHRVIRPDGKIRVVIGRGKVIKDKKGNAVKMHGTSRDITEESSLDMAKADFVSLASHQLRTPATGVKMLLSLLKDGYAGELTDRQKNIIENAYETNERQLKIANDLLGIARLEAGRVKLKKKNIELNSWILQILEQHREIISQRNQLLDIRVRKKATNVRVDPERLNMAIDNLLDNASKYTPASGKITVALQANKTHACIIIKDTGIGIPKEELTNIFKFFTRVDTSLNNQVEGSGLGLYLVKNIIDLHKGEVKIISSRKNGTTFKLYLPLSKVI